MKDIFNQLYGASGIERHARPFAEFANPGESAMEMRWWRTAPLGPEDDLRPPWRNRLYSARAPLSSNERLTVSECAFALAATIAGPSVILGTKRPSITSI